MGRLTLPFACVYRSMNMIADQDPARLQDDIKTQVTQMMNASGVGNQINDLSDCILNRLKDK